MQNNPNAAPAPHWETTVTLCLRAHEIDIRACMVERLQKHVRQIASGPVLNTTEIWRVILPDLEIINARSCSHVVKNV